MGRGGGPQVQKSQQRQAEPFASIKSLPQYTDVVAKLEKGESCNSIARWLKDSGQFEELQVRSVARQLSRFWSSREGTTAVVRQEAALPEPEFKAAVEHRIQEITDLEEMKTLQKERIDILHKHEKKLNYLLPAGRQEIAEFRTLCHILIDKKRELGILKGARQEPTTVITETRTTNVQVNVGSSDRQAAMKVIENPQSRRKVIEALHSLTGGKAEVEDRVQVGDRGVEGEA